MRRVAMSGSSFRFGLIRDEGKKQNECSMYTGINNRIISEILRGRQVFDKKNEKERGLIYDWYASCLNPITFEDFWWMKWKFKGERM
jgi:hypothetical protein